MSRGAFFMSHRLPAVTIARFSKREGYRSSIRIVFITSAGVEDPGSRMVMPASAAMLESTTLPKTEWQDWFPQSFEEPSGRRPSRNGVGTNVMKNWLPFVPLPARNPAFAIDMMPGLSCLRSAWNSLSNL